MRKYLLPSCIVLAWAIWTIALIRYGMGDPHFYGNSTSLSFSKSGAFGDSYGAVASLMAALAAAGAFLAFSEQREATTRQNFEGNFFSLLSHLQDIVSQIDVVSLRNRRTVIKGKPRIDVEIQRTYEGRDAFRRLVQILRESLKPDNFNNVKVVCGLWNPFYDKWANDLAHYFRLLYHIFRLIDETCPGDKLYYARIVRAHLSSSEIALLGYNCICGEGREKFIKYVKQFSLMHNYHVIKNNAIIEAEYNFFMRKLGREAFSDRTLLPVVY